MSAILINDKDFELFIDRQRIAGRIGELAARIDSDYRDLNPLFLAVLNGSFIFAADLFRSLTISVEISFIKLASYKGTSSSGNVITAIGMEERLNGRHVIILEDIVDTGKTLNAFMPEVLQRDPLSVKIAAFLTKPSALQYEVKVDYVGFEIPDRFVVGYGLDYDGAGRQLPDLHVLVEDGSGHI